MSIGERITELRKDKRISQAELAKAMDVSRQAVSKWENDQMAPDSMKLIHLADVLDTDLEYLTTGRRTYSRRPPVVIKEIQTVEVEKILEIEKTIEVEKTVEVERIVEKPVIRRVKKTIVRRNPAEYCAVGLFCFLAGLLVGLMV